jgi:hypothetical protein
MKYFDSLGSQEEMGRSGFSANKQKFYPSFDKTSKEGSTGRTIPTIEHDESKQAMD